VIVTRCLELAVYRYILKGSCKAFYYLEGGENDREVRETETGFLEMHSKVMT